ncbi:hypothetical protein K1X45_01675 [Pseudochrobactrum sp. Wa41.01b-1]|uniref:hypothetical protein n=1 Tax=Pseudochrobactrum sp. Wa41.01b-1 TaxID=2864102 RepID=UPI001C690CE9|nr:hypothetical protein [Pseudochrobactrum sp. Wa41.01b-1]QYM73186.1 hypothetical protein K1X45_01675 [Pseudochrobactrum sp. Wa41.01b-1]
MIMAANNRLLEVFFIRSRMCNNHRGNLRESFSDAEPTLESMDFKTSTLHYSLYSSGNAFIASSHVLLLGIGKLAIGENAGFAIELSPILDCVDAVKLPASTAMKGTLAAQQSKNQSQPMMNIVRLMS